MITLDQVTRIFGPITAVDRVSFEVPAGAVCVLLGPSGCGKTTTMKMINRLIAPTSGKIHVDGRDTAGLDEVTLRRSIGYVIQQVGLFPNKTVEDNICVVPDLLGWDRRKSRARAAELLEMVNLEPAVFLKRWPKELSGGQAQRIGVVRALAADPPVLLMDEPFGAIDPINREVIQDEFLKLQAALKKTVVLVSHDIDEAVKLASRIAIFRDGRLIQYDAPDVVLSHPADAFVADFVGSDRTLKRLRLLRVEEVMAKDAPRLVAGDTLDKAARLMEERGDATIVLVGPEGEARGCVTLEAARNGAGSLAAAREALPAVVHVRDDLRRAVSLMFTHDVSWLACVDDEGRFQGSVTQRGIARALGTVQRAAQ